MPGGFAHGDYLRTGALARFSPVMDAVAAFAGRGWAGRRHLQRLPGAHRGRAAARGVAKNAGLKFLCDTVECRVDSTRSVLTGAAATGDVLRLPINHFEGNYICDDVTLAQLRADDRIVLRYVRNPNGSLDNIAGICNERGNVVGLMPQPERASDGMLGSADGVVLLRSLLQSAAVVDFARVIPAFLSTSAPTPSSRHVAYTMPARVPYAPATLMNSASIFDRSTATLIPSSSDSRFATLLDELQPLQRGGLGEALLDDGEPLLHPSVVRLRPRRGRLCSRASRYAFTARPSFRPAASACLCSADMLFGANVDSCRLFR